MKQCSKCKTEKMKVDFSTTQWKKKSGNTCKTCTETKTVATSKIPINDEKVMNSSPPYCVEFRSGVINVPVAGLEHRLLFSPF